MLQSSFGWASGRFRPAWGRGVLLDLLDRPVEVGFLFGWAPSWSGQLGCVRSGWVIRSATLGRCLSARHGYDVLSTNIVFARGGPLRLHVSLLARLVSVAREKRNGL